MQFERKEISKTETLIFMTQSLPIIGTFYYDKNTQTTFDIINNIASSDLAEAILLTSDFIYIKSKDSSNIDELETISIAELDDFSANPITTTAPTDNIIPKIIIILKAIIAPFLQKDGGDIKFSQYQNRVVTVSFLGKCKGCPYAQRTLKERVEKNLIKYIPEINEVRLEWKK